MKEKDYWKYKPIPIEDTILFIRMNLPELRNVTKLAEVMGYSRSHFSFSVKKHFGKTPSELLREERFKRIKEEILKHPYETSHAIACRVGLIKNTRFENGDKAMYRFLSTHQDTNFKQLRKELLYGKKSNK